LRLFGRAFIAGAFMGRTQQMKVKEIFMNYTSVVAAPLPKSFTYYQE
jgi:hypothetical protein